MLGRVKCGGPEGEYRWLIAAIKITKPICGTEDEIIVVHGRLLSPARNIPKIVILLKGTVKEKCRVMVT